VAAGDPHVSWNLLADLGDLLRFPFMVHAYAAGTVAAVTAAVLGWFTVLRRQSFAAHTLAVAAFPGAAAALWLGIGASWGYFGFAGGAAVLIGLAPGGGNRRFGGSSAVVGLVQAGALAAGYLFVSLHGGNLNGITALLFGSFLGITSGQVVTLTVLALVALGVVAMIGRPLLFASVDPVVAEARGIPVRLLSIGFLLLLGIATAEVVAITGTLLVFALLIMPVATAQLLTLRPGPGLALAIGLAVASTWAGLTVAYYTPYPVGFFITSITFALYVGAHLVRALAERAGGAPGTPGDVAAGTRP